MRSTAAVAAPTVRTRPPQLRLLVVEQGCEDVDRAFDDAKAETTVESVPALEDARTRFDDIDCLVVQPPTVADDRSGDREGSTDVIDRLETIRSDAPELPVVVLVDERTPDLVRTVRSYDWTAVLERDEAFARLAHRVLDLLEHHRLTVLSRRSLASLEFAGDAIAMTSPEPRGERCSPTRPSPASSRRRSRPSRRAGGGPGAVPADGKWGRRSRLGFGSAGSRMAVWCSRSTNPRGATSPQREVPRLEHG